MGEHREEIGGDGKRILWGGDFNRHHSMWDNNEDDRLFTRSALNDAQRLIDLLGEWGM
jgi:hypothetical protein